MLQDEKLNIYSTVLASVVGIDVRSSKFQYAFNFIP